jgi:hypothetical protein
VVQFYKITPNRQNEVDVNKQAWTREKCIFRGLFNKQQADRCCTLNTKLNVDTRVMLWISRSIVFYKIPSSAGETTKHQKQFKATHVRKRLGLADGSGTRAGGCSFILLADSPSIEVKDLRRKLSLSMILLAYLIIHWLFIYDAKNTDNLLPCEKKK